MSNKYKFEDQESLYFITFSVVGWIDVFTRAVYKDILLDCFRHCIKEKGLAIHAYVIMSNHVHMIIGRKGEPSLSDIMRDLKKFSSFRILQEIKQNPQESRKEWLLYLFAKAGKQNSNNKNYQFWQQDNHPIELHPTRNLFDQKLNYIHQNPVTAGLVNSASAYVYSSASNYEFNEGVLQEVEVLY
ncbi:MAG: transposase [Mucilaginibacter sp.]|nr:transposase [Mucilaginibacter sp.]